ncbi:MAG: cell division protein FtsA [Sulfurovum sp.]|nr:cell division protein FtsA [Sulfurovum sp.]MCB4746287.1 cell division protein FtsA [Sulfurovum sp.]MCB4748717.1 cell division protein FtsA [Sulfurovum sp.]MCB4763246.1 cell division protein FtsA [Sulfurovum sp.]MCB4766308.1 cell division protein FtsA [Sulfurovum sp.]
MSDTVLAIDIGSTKICAIIAEIKDEGVQVLGHGVSKSRGVKKGAITNIEMASKSIKKAISNAKRIAGNNITSAIVSISNAYAKSLNSTGIVNIAHKDISIKEINRVLQTALYNAKIPNEYEVIHVLPYNFRVDDQGFVEDPFGMNASRMEVDANIIITQKSNLSNLKKAVRSAGIEIDNIVLSGYASTIAVMDRDERELGAAIIDLGGQTSNLVVHVGNSIRYNDFLGVGSNHITNDLSMALHTPLQVAEEVKIQYGDLSETSNEVIEFPIIGEEEENRNGVSLEIVRSVIFARVEEALMILDKLLEKSTLKEQIGAGVILTGGMTKLKGIRELAQSVFTSLPVRIAKPRELEGLFGELRNPSYATVVGLLLYKAGEYTQYEINFNQEMLHSKTFTRTDNNLEDIKLEHTQQEPQTETLLSEEEKSEVETTVIFDDLPNSNAQKNNPVERFFNWTKQLF